MRRLSSIVLTIGAILSVMSPLSAQVVSRLISFGDDIDPGPTSLLVTQVRQVRINSSGSWAALVFTAQGHRLLLNGSVVIAQGDTISTTPALCVGSIGDFDLSNNGDIAVFITDCAITPDQVGLFLLPASTFGAASLVPLAVEGDLAPTISTGTHPYRSLNSVRIGDDNTLILTASLTNGAQQPTVITKITYGSGGSPITSTNLLQPGIVALGTAPSPGANDDVLGGFSTGPNQLAWKWSAQAAPLFVGSLDAGSGNPNPSFPGVVYLDSNAPVSNQVVRQHMATGIGSDTWNTFDGVDANQCGGVALVGRATVAGTSYVARWPVSGALQVIASENTNIGFPGSNPTLGDIDSHVVICAGACSAGNLGEVIWRGTAKTGGASAILANLQFMVITGITSDGASSISGLGASGVALWMDASDDGSKVIFIGTSPDPSGAHRSRAFLLSRDLDGSAFCSGDGSLSDHTTPCPCSNNGAPGNGCAHSFDPNGANMSATGSMASDTIVLHSQFEPASSFTLMMQHGNAGDSVFHDGVLCASNPLIRLRGRAAVGGEAFFPNSLFANDVTTTLSARGGTFPGSGSTMRYAAWYRNASTTFCPPATANVTNGWQITW